MELIADSYDRWQAAHAIGFVAIVALAPAVLGLAFLVRRRQPTFGLVAGSLALAGLLGLAAVITIDGFAWGVAGELSTNPEVGPDGAAAALKELQESGWSYVYYLAPARIHRRHGDAGSRGGAPGRGARLGGSPAGARRADGRHRDRDRFERLLHRGRDACCSRAEWPWQPRSCA